MVEQNVKEEILDKVSEHESIKNIDGNELYFIQEDNFVAQGRVSELNDGSIQFKLPGGNNYESYVKFIVVSRQANGSFRLESTELRSSDTEWNKKTGGLEKRITNTCVYTTNDIDELVEKVTSLLNS